MIELTNQDLTCFVQESVERKLRAAFSPTFLEIVNESQHHHGHRGSPGTGASHFKILIASEDLRSLSRVQAHRAIYQVLQEEIAGPVHAVSIEIR